MSASGQRIAPLVPAAACDLAELWHAGGFDASMPGEGLAAALDVEEEEAWIRQALDVFGECGCLLYGSDGLIAYAKYAPPELFGARGGGVAARIDRDAILLAGLCVAPELAGGGFSKLLLQAVERDLHKRGLPLLEAFACPGDPVAGPTACRPLDFYEENGFRVRQRVPAPPIVRLELKSLVSWTENLESALDGLLQAAAAALPRKAPAPSPTTWPHLR